MDRWKDDVRTPEAQAKMDDLYEKIKRKIEGLVCDHCEDDIKDIPDSKFDNFIKVLADEVWNELICQAYEDMYDIDIIHYAQDMLTSPMVMLEWLYEENRLPFWIDFFSKKKHRD